MKKSPSQMQQCRFTFLYHSILKGYDRKQNIFLESTQQGLQLSWRAYIFIKPLRWPKRFSQKCRRIVLHYIKKKKGEETPITTHATPPLNKSTYALVKTKRWPKLLVKTNLSKNWDNKLHIFHISISSCPKIWNFTRYKIIS